jgi:hypothetical protein
MPMRLGLGLYKLFLASTILLLRWGGYIPIDTPPSPPASLACLAALLGMPSFQTVFRHALLRRVAAILVIALAVAGAAEPGIAAVVDRWRLISTLDELEYDMFEVAMAIQQFTEQEPLAWSPFNNIEIQLRKFPPPTYVTILYQIPAEYIVIDALETLILFLAIPLHDLEGQRRTRATHETRVEELGSCPSRWYWLWLWNWPCDLSRTSPLNEDNMQG